MTERRPGHARRLQISASGGWYVALTVLLGVVALVSGNNVLYLIESLLLSGLILSGVLSERTVSGVSFEVLRRPAVARTPVQDQIRIVNRRRASVFCLEIGEYTQGEFIPLCFVPRLAPRETLIVPSRQVLPARGIHRWDGLALATRYPFGFAKKVALVPSPGQRIVWPASAGDRPGQSRSDTVARTSGASDLEEGEIRAYTQDDDYRSIVWTLSAKGMDPVVRNRGSSSRRRDAVLDLRMEPGDAFEEHVSRIAGALHAPLRDSDEERGVSLTVQEWGGKRVIRGRARALNELALTQAQGEQAQSARSVAPQEAS
jgi:uncharacterized protein (DUF58 family)